MDERHAKLAAEMQNMGVHEPGFRQQVEEIVEKMPAVPSMTESFLRVVGIVLGGSLALLIVLFGLTNIPKMGNNAYRWFVNADRVEAQGRLISDQGRELDDLKRDVWNLKALIPQPVDVSKLGKDWTAVAADQFSVVGTDSYVSCTPPQLFSGELMNEVIREQNEFFTCVAQVLKQLQKK